VAKSHTRSLPNHGFFKEIRGLDSIGTAAAYHQNIDQNQKPFSFDWLRLKLRLLTVVRHQEVRFFSRVGAFAIISVFAIAFLAGIGEARGHSWRQPAVRSFTSV
jgi:hypothetical protein